MTKKVSKKATKKASKKTAERPNVRKNVPSKTRSLRVMRSRFSAMVPRLIDHAIVCGYEVTIGDVFRDPRCSVHYGKANSAHRRGLAIDLNLFLNGKYLQKTSDHEFLGEYWESIGGTWGGRFDDGNHYSLAWRGMR